MQIHLVQQSHSRYLSYRYKSTRIKKFYTAVLEIAKKTQKTNKQSQKAKCASINKRTVNYVMLCSFQRVIHMYSPEKMFICLTSKLQTYVWHGCSFLVEDNTSQTAISIQWNMQKELLINCKQELLLGVRGKISYASCTNPLVFCFFSPPKKYFLTLPYIS